MIAHRAACNPSAESDWDEVEERNGNLKAGQVVNPSYGDNQPSSSPTMTGMGQVETVRAKPSHRDSRKVRSSVEETEEA